MLDEIGMEYGVLVQPAAHGTDWRSLATGAVARAPAAARDRLARC